MVEKVYIRELQYTDAPALLAFEHTNRAWFDAHIEARPPSFYSLQGVADHIDTYLQGLAAGTWHPFVLCNHEGDIVGRANLKNIDPATGEAEVGYRIAQQATRQGLATLALEHLMHQARVRWALQTLVAWAFNENIGSRRVLQGCGFHEAETNDSEIDTRTRRFVYPLLPLGRKP